MVDTVGFICRNTAGTVQIDQRFKNRAFRGKATVTTTAAFGDNGGSYVDVNLSGVSSPRLALRCAVGAAVWWMTGSGSTRSVRIATTGGVGTSITYYWFDVPAGGSGPIGLLVKNPATLETTFDSRLRYMTHAGFHTGVMFSGSFSQTYITGRTYAAIQARTGYWSHTQPIGPIGGGSNFLMTGIPAFKTITNGLAQDDILILSTINNAGQTVPELSFPADLLAIDVTGL